MPPRIPSLRAPAGSRVLSAVRPFSCSASFAAPSREAPYPNHSSSTTTTTTPSSSPSSSPFGSDANNNNGNGNNRQSAPRSPRGSSSGNLLAMHRSPRGGPPGPSSDPQQAAQRLQERVRARAGELVARRQGTVDRLREQQLSASYLREMPRLWQPGDVYSPHDLSPGEMDKWRKRTRRNVDIVDALGLRPEDLYKNFSLIEEFTNDTAQILSPNATRLRPVNQRKVAKMVRRAQGMGLYPTIHAHPELLRNKFFR